MKTWTEPALLRLSIVTCNPLDGEVLAASFRADPSFSISCSTTSIDVAAAIAQGSPPNAVLLDAQFIDQDRPTSIATIVEKFVDVPILLLDTETNDIRLSAVLRTTSVGYFTRLVSFAELAEAVRKQAGGERAYCIRVRKRIERTSLGWRFRRDPPHSPFAILTRRESEIARLIAVGNSLRGCAGILHLSPKTVDNHKSRLMKKLGLSKALELTRLAIREGLIPL